MFVFVYLHKYTSLFLFRFYKWNKDNPVIPSVAEGSQGSIMGKKSGDSSTS